MKPMNMPLGVCHALRCYAPAAGPQLVDGEPVEAFAVYCRLHRRNPMAEPWRTVEVTPADLQRELQASLDAPPPENPWTSQPPLSPSSPLTSARSPSSTLPGAWLDDPAKQPAESVTPWTFSTLSDGSSPLVVASTSRSPERPASSPTPSTTSRPSAPDSASPPAPAEVTSCPIPLSKASSACTTDVPPTTATSATTTGTTTATTSAATSAEACPVPATATTSPGTTGSSTTPYIEAARGLAGSADGGEAERELLDFWNVTVRGNADVRTAGLAGLAASSDSAAAASAPAADTSAQPATASPSELGATMSTSAPEPSASSETSASSKREPVVCAWPGCDRKGKFLCPRDLNRVNTLVKEKLVSKVAPATWPEAWARRNARVGGQALVAVGGRTREQLEEMGFEWGSAGGPVVWLMRKLEEARASVEELQAVVQSTPAVEQGSAVAIVPPKVGDRWGDLTPEQRAMVPVGSEVFHSASVSTHRKLAPDKWGDYAAHDNRNEAAEGTWYCLGEEVVITRLGPAPTAPPEPDRSGWPVLVKVDDGSYAWQSGRDAVYHATTGQWWAFADVWPSTESPDYPTAREAADAIHARLPDEVSEAAPHVVTSPTGPSGIRCLERSTSRGERCIKELLRMGNGDLIHGGGHVFVAGDTSETLADRPKLGDVSEAARTVAHQDWSKPWPHVVRDGDPGVAHLDESGLRALAEHHAAAAQPHPTPGTGDVWREILDQLPPELEPMRAACEARRTKGLQTYGTALQRDNGREHKVDEAQELLDAAAYRACWATSARDIRAVRAYIREAGELLGVLPTIHSSCPGCCGDLAGLGDEVCSRCADQLRETFATSDTHQAMRAALLRIVGEPSEDEVAAAGMEQLTDAELLTQVEHLVRRRRRAGGDLEETAAQVIRWQVAFLRSIAADLEETYGFSARQVVIGLRSIADTLGSLVEVRRVFVAPAAVEVARG